MLQACSKHYRPNRLGRVLFMGARGRFAFGRSRPRPSIRKGCLRLAQSGRRKAGRMAAPAGKLTTTAPFFIGGILRRKALALDKEVIVLPRMGSAGFCLERPDL